MAIGASRGQILRLVLRQGLTLSLAGAVLGLAVSVPLFRAGLGTPDRKTLVLVPLGLMAVTLCACWIPARRATRIDPIATLREDRAVSDPGLYLPIARVGVTRARGSGRTHRWQSE